MRTSNALTRTAGLSLVLLLCAAGCERRSEPLQPQSYSLEFLGTIYDWEGVAPSPRGGVDDWATLFMHFHEDFEGVAAALSDIASRYSDDHYTLLMALRDFTAQIPISPETGPVSYARAQHDGWNTTSRAVFLTAILRSLGFAATPLQAGDRGLVGLAVEEQQLNAHRVTYTVERPRLFSTQETHVTLLVWDPEGRIGSPGLDASESVDLLLGPADLFHLGEGERLDFRHRSIPPDLYQEQEYHTLPLPGQASVSYHLYPDVAEWLAAYPEFHFTAQLALEYEESHRIRLAPRMDDSDETSFISALLQGVQQHFEYVEGPLRSIHQILASRQGDCDQLALVLGLMLLEAGYTADDLIVIIWDDADHMGLGIRPRTPLGAPREGIRYEVAGASYYVLDPTFYHWRGDQLVSAWGQMTPDNRNRAPVIQHLEALP